MHRPNVRLLGALAISGSLGMTADSAHAQEGPATESAPSAQTASSWSDDITLGVFVDAYAALRSDHNDRRPPPPAGTAAPGGYPHEAYVQASGFALALAGMDVAYAGEQFGATISLRVGPAVTRFYAADQGPLGIDNITQAYASWKPITGLTLDLGQFYTPYGAEVLESFRNLNYSRGALHYAMQPFWHTGLRANYAINDRMAVSGLMVNGVNTAFEGNKSPSLGVQALATPIDALAITVGYLGALNPRDGDEGPVDADGDPSTPEIEQKFDHFFDLVAVLTLGDFKLVSNVDLNLYRLDGSKDGENWWGLSVAPRYAFTNWFAAAARAEFLSDSANQVFGMAGVPAGDVTSLTTLTGTLDFKPVPNSTAVVLRPEARYEMSSDDYFLGRDNKPSQNFWTLMLGAVVTNM